MSRGWGQPSAWAPHLLPPGGPPFSGPRPLPLDLTWRPDPALQLGPWAGSGLRPAERCCLRALRSPSLILAGTWGLQGRLEAEVGADGGPAHGTAETAPFQPFGLGVSAAQAPPCQRGGGPRVLFSGICPVPTGIRGAAGRLRGERLQTVSSAPGGRGSQQVFPAASKLSGLQGSGSVAWRGFPSRGVIPGTATRGQKCSLLARPLRLSPTSARFFLVKNFMDLLFFVLWALAAAPGLSPVAVSGLAAPGLQQLWHPGVGAPWHAGSSEIGDQTPAPCAGRWIPTHGASRAVPATRSCELNVWGRT